MTASLPSVLLRIEGAAVGAGAVVVYFDQGQPWWLLLVLALAPDLAMVGYLAGPRAGAVSYDVAHTYALPVALGVYGLLAGQDRVMAVALVWLAHIGVDRLLGYGLKYPAAFKDTHLQRV
ncbi:MAG TPA: DUF4260 domain-containing protein [Gaiellaceae bacterium]|nr:DUF4260 domain-containing protein [Gaiellaceae bacterium]